ncbi:MAG: hypothetical protein H6Q13_39 [Bacteroidetes bacterium]|nr:hypothetical protein [Bacteroidota bacterium]
MKPYKLLSISFCLLCFCSCKDHHAPRILTVVDSLTYVNPDSAIMLLGQLESSIAKESEATQIYYQLLNIKAEDKACITHTSDSLIKQVLNYYEGEKDKEHLPEAYYYAGRVYIDLGDAPQALAYLQKAIKVSKGSTNYRLVSMTYNQIGVLYLYQRIYDKALDVFKGAYQYTTLSGDSTLIVYNLRNIGRAYTQLNNVESTSYYYKRAGQIAEKINDPHLVSTVNQEMAGFYRHLGEYGKAFEVLQAAHKPKSDPASYYTVLANLYYEASKIDSAQYYYTQLLSIGNSYDNKGGYYYDQQGGYKGLSKIARQQGRLAEALGYMDKYLAYTDSLQKANDAEGARKVNALYNYQLREKENHRLEEIAQKQKIWIVLLSASIVIILIIVFAAGIIYRQRKKQRKIQAERQQEKLKEIVDEQYRSSRQFIAENEKRIEKLKEKLQNTESQKDELEKNLQEGEKELLELINRQIETKQKIQALSETAFRELQIYKDFYHIAGMPNAENISEKQKITSKDWEELIVVINRTYNHFTGRLQALYPSISEHELRICMLIKIAIPPVGIAKLTAHSKQAITSSRKKLYEKTHNQPGTPDLWDNFIQNF